MAVAMFQPVTRGELSDMAGADRRRAPQPKLGAPYAYVTTEKFLFEFGLESLRDLPDLEKLQDAGLLGPAGREEPGRAGLAPSYRDGCWPSLPDSSGLWRSSRSMSAETE